MSRYGLTPSVITYNSLIDACGRAGDVDRARQVFCSLKEAGLSPNDRTFSALIHSHAVQGQVTTDLNIVYFLEDAMEWQFRAAEGRGWEGVGAKADGGWAWAWEREGVNAGVIVPVFTILTIDGWIEWCQTWSTRRKLHTAKYI